MNKYLRAYGTESKDNQNIPIVYSQNVKIKMNIKWNIVTYASFPIYEEDASGYGLKYLYTENLYEPVVMYGPKDTGNLDVVVLGKIVWKYHTLVQADTSEASTSGGILSGSDTISGEMFTQEAYYQPINPTSISIPTGTRTVAQHAEDIASISKQLKDLRIMVSYVLFRPPYNNVSPYFMEEGLVVRGYLKNIQVKVKINANAKLSSLQDYLNNDSSLQSAANKLNEAINNLNEIKKQESAPEKLLKAQQSVKDAEDYQARLFATMSDYYSKLLKDGILKGFVKASYVTKDMENPEVKLLEYKMQHILQDSEAKVSQIAIDIKNSMARVNALVPVSLVGKQENSSFVSDWFGGEATIGKDKTISYTNISTTPIDANSYVKMSDNTKHLVEVAGI